MRWDHTGLGVCRLRASAPVDRALAACTVTAVIPDTGVFSASPPATRDAYVRLVLLLNMNKWSKSFDERPRRRWWIFYGEQCYVTPISLEHCHRLPQSCRLRQSHWDRYWFFCTKSRLFHVGYQEWLTQSWPQSVSDSFETYGGSI